MKQEQKDPLHPQKGTTHPLLISHKVRTPSLSSGDGNVHNRSKHKREKKISVSEWGETVVVAVDGTKNITKDAFEWALVNAANYHDKISFLAIIPGWNTWGVSVFNTFFTKSYRLEDDHKIGNSEVHKSISSMLQQFHKQIDLKKVVVSVDVISAQVKGVTAREAKRLRAAWIVIDRNLKEEGKFCLEESQSNVVIVKTSSPKILRMNLKQVSITTDYSLPSDSSNVLPDVKVPELAAHQAKILRNPNLRLTSADESLFSIPTSSPESHIPPNSTGDYIVSEMSFSRPIVLALTSGGDTNTEDQKSNELWLKDPNQVFSDSGTPDASHSTGSVPRSSREQSVKSSAENQWEIQAMGNTTQIMLVEQVKLSNSMTVLEIGTSESLPASPLLTPKNSSFGLPSSQSLLSYSPQKLGSVVIMPDALQLEEDNVRKVPFKKNMALTNPCYQGNSQFNEKARSDLRVQVLNQVNESQTLRILTEKLQSRGIAMGAPPLCSICQHKSPIFGQPPKKFSFHELELATNFFSTDNFLAEGGFGSVYRGVFPDGQAIAVKQHKLASSQGDKEFCSEVEILSCAQHRNVVMLIGFCIEDSRRLLVYEFVCNGSLDTHLYGQKNTSLKWCARLKIAIGAARGLRYLHEECRAGCIVHRDMRPNNILLTHDFEPMVGDFGLARWQPGGNQGVHTRVMGTFGYLAPEYVQSAQITDKADVYSFGIVLLELVSGRKAIDFTQPKGQHCLAEWARQQLAAHAYQNIIDPHLHFESFGTEQFCMLQAASLCILQDPHSRPRMSQVLRLLEGDTTGGSLSFLEMDKFKGYSKAGTDDSASSSSSSGTEKRRFSGRFISPGYDNIMLA